MTKRLTALLLLGLLPVASAAPTTAAGKAIFSANCAGCHGANAQGVVGPNLKDAANWKFELFKRAVLTGKDDKGVALKAMMPRFTKGFAPHSGKAPSDEQLKSLQLFLKTVTK